MAVDPVSLGFTLALTAANMAMTASQNIEGPRTTDLTATVADYGTPLNYFYNTRWLTCPCFFAEDIRERKKRRKTKGGKYSEYTYFGTWAVQIADHAISQVRKIKFDGHLVYDVTSSEPLFELGEDYELSESVRFYYGTADQMPDPRMLASVEYDQGEGTCPAYRNQSYLMFEDIPLEKVGNRLPIVTGEFVSGGGVSTLEFDFKNGIYTIDGAATTLDALIDPYSEIGPITPGVGWVASPDEASNGLLINSDIFSQLGGTIEGEVFGSFSRESSETVAAGANFRAVLIGADANYLKSTTLSAHTQTLDTQFGFGFLAINSEAVTLATDTLYEVGYAFTNSEATGTLGAVTSTKSGSDFAVTGLYFEHTAQGSGAPDPTSTTIERITVRAAASEAFSLADILSDLSIRGGMSEIDFDYSQLAGIIPDGFSWSQGSGKQIVGPLPDVYDFDFRPHDFMLEALPKGGASQGTISDFAKGSPRHALVETGDSDLPRRIYLNFADVDSDQQTNTAVSQRRRAAVNSVREPTLDVTTLALNPTDARRFADRYLRRQWFQRNSAQSGLSRAHLGIEPGDVWTPIFDGQPQTMSCGKMTIGADGAMPIEWRSDAPGLAIVSDAAGAEAAGIPPAVIYAPSNTVGAVLDLPLLIDAHDQTTPLAYLAAGPTDGTRAWPGADFSQSDTGEADSFAAEWDAVDGIYASEIGTATDALPDAEPWNFDDASTIEVVLNSGELTSTTLAAMIEDSTLNLALIGDELVQFRTATLTDTLTYTLSGFLRGQRGTERNMATHEAGERFIALGAVKKRIMGAGEIGDTDSYIASTVGKAASEANAFELTYTGASHRPYAPVYGSAELSGADWAFDATRRTRVGATTLNGQDVPLGEASEAWELDIMDGATVVRTITATALPIAYPEADQITDFGSAQGTIAANLYQMNPTLNLRGYPLSITG